MIEAVQHAPAAAVSATPQAIRVTMLGLRGFPNVQGGVENHVENLAAGLIELGCEVEVIVRSAYVPKGVGVTWRGIRMVRLWAPRTSGVETFCHAFLGVMRAAVTRPDILHIHAIGPALYTPLARALGLRVVVTHHSANYENEKWGRLGRALLRLGEAHGMLCANQRIAVSESLAGRMRRSYQVPVFAIPNGITAPSQPAATGTLEAFGLQPGRYALCVARIDQQKRQLDLIDAMAATKGTGWPLALVGGADHDVDYVRAVKSAASGTPGVVMLGHQSGDALAELYGKAGVFVLPSSHEGQPIAVLEAMSYGCPMILSDIPAHREIAPEGTGFVAVGDIPALAAHLEAVFSGSRAARIDPTVQARIARDHDWLAIAHRTLGLYRNALPAVSRPR